MVDRSNEFLLDAIFGKQMELLLLLYGGEQETHKTKFDVSFAAAAASAATAGALHNTTYTRHCFDVCVEVRLYVCFGLVKLVLFGA